MAPGSYEIDVVNFIDRLKIAGRDNVITIDTRNETFKDYKLVYKNAALFITVSTDEYIVPAVKIACLHIRKNTPQE